MRAIRHEMLSNCSFLKFLSFSFNLELSVELVHKFQLRHLECDPGINALVVTKNRNQLAVAVLNYGMRR